MLDDESISDQDENSGNSPNGSICSPNDDITPVDYPSSVNNPDYHSKKGQNPKSLEQKNPGSDKISQGSSYMSKKPMRKESSKKVIDLTGRQSEDSIKILQTSKRAPPKKS
jgi:hypothetical protein